jgi:acyl carrier protein
MEELIENLKVDIIKALNLEEVSPQDIDPEAPLFMEGLGLDSIDGLELIVLLEKKYDLKIPTAEEGKQVLYSVKTMADAILANRKA